MKTLENAVENKRKPTWTRNICFYDIIIIIIIIISITVVSFTRKWNWWNLSQNIARFNVFSTTFIRTLYDLPNYVVFGKV
jgi:hypothetical protein